jgi:hypothetical protein
VTHIYILPLVGAIVALAVILELLRRRQLTEKYAIIWLILGAGIVVIAIWPRILYRASELAGIAVPSNLLFFLAAFVLLFVCLQLSREASRLEEETRTLAEELALLRQELLQLQQRP